MVNGTENPGARQIFLLDMAETARSARHVGCRGSDTNAPFVMDRADSCADGGGGQRRRTAHFRASTYCGGDEGDPAPILQAFPLAPLKSRGAPFSPGCCGP
jgi:hypothetical protein